MSNDKPRGHSFDGIQELDNDLPGWWVALFLLTIIFGVGYLVWYHLGIFPAQSLAEHYEDDVVETRAIAASRMPADGDVAATTSAPNDAGALASAKSVFVSTCGPCHGLVGQGVVGPNLTDDYWLHGHTPAELEHVITTGIPEKGMPAWGEVLGNAKVKELVAYIRSIQGTNPPAAKAPQGETGKLQ